MTASSTEQPPKAESATMGQSSALLRLSNAGRCPDEGRAALSCAAGFQLQTNIDKVVRRPWAGVLEVQAIAKLLGHAIDRGIKFGLAISLQQKCRIHDHLVANRFVVARGDTDG